MLVSPVTLFVMGAGAVMTKEDYDRLVEAFKIHPDKPAEVARLTGIDRVLAWKGWHKGWKALNLPPIRERLAEPPEVTARRVVAEAAQKAEGAARRLVEDATARAVLEVTAEEAARTVKERIAREAREAKEQAAAKAENRDNAVVVLDEERRLRKGARTVSGQNILASARWGTAHQQVADELIRKVEAERKAMTASELAELARIMAQVDRARMALLKEAIELERLHRGDPALIVGITPVEMNATEAVQEIERANLALQRYRRRGLELLEGGAGGSEGETINVTPTS